MKILAPIFCFLSFINHDKISKKNLKLIKESHNLIQNCINNLYLIGELVLLNNKKY